MCSLLLAESLAKAILEKAMHTIYMKELETKVKPYVICDTLF